MMKKEAAVLSHSRPMKKDGRRGVTRATEEKNGPLGSHAGDRRRTKWQKQ